VETSIPSGTDAEPRINSEISDGKAVGYVGDAAKKHRSADDTDDTQANATERTHSGSACDCRGGATTSDSTCNGSTCGGIASIPSGYQRNLIHRQFMHHLLH
jgi:hypothetical protein